MAKKIIRTGTTADPTGDSLKNAFVKVNDNFTELYNALGLDADTLNIGAFEFAGSTMTTTDSSAIVIDQAATITSNLSVGGDIVPQTALGGDLGSSTLPWRSLYVSNNTIYIGGTAVGLDVSGNLTTGGTVVGSTPAWTNITGKPSFATVATTGAYADLTGKPTIPTLVSQLANDSGFLTSVGNISNIQSEGDINIEVNLTDSTKRIWQFGEDGNLVVPGDINLSGGTISQYSQNGLTGLKLVANADQGQNVTIMGTGNNTFPILNYVGTTLSGITIGTPEGDWNFMNGNLTIPGDIRSEGNINIDINLADSTLRRWQFGEDGNLTLPAGGNISEGGGLSGAIRLTPAGGANANQALLIYPTAQVEGDHIHLTAGGGTTELYLGSDLHYVKLGKGAPYNGTIVIAATGWPNTVAGIISSGNWAVVSLSNLATTGGTGTGLTVTVTQVAGVATAIAIVSGLMEGYTANDTITVTSGAATATFTISVLAPQWVFAPDGDLYIPTGKTIRDTGNGDDIRRIPGPYADDAAAAAASVAVGNPYHKTGTSGQVFVRLT
jgi:hypothetical protein